MTAPTEQQCELRRRAEDNATLTKEVALLKAQLEVALALNAKLVEENTKLKESVFAWPAPPQPLLDTAGKPIPAWETVC